MRKWMIWTIWLVFTVGLSAWIGIGLLNTTIETQSTASTNVSADNGFFLIGETTSGHHQIELACENCHTDPFGGEEILQEACENCHLAELNAVRDAHPKRKFTDPSNADRIAVLDARYCVTCHREHKADITQAMGLTVPEDVCFLCHENIGEDRETHKDLAFDTCASSGCHNFHDNRALFEDFLVENADQPRISSHPLIAPLTAVEALYMEGAIASAAESGRLTLGQADAPANLMNSDVAESWAGSVHAAASVNCNGCHEQNGIWQENVSLQQCADCHEDQNSGFLLGKHGMRIDAGLPPMTPAMARIPMHESAHQQELTCTSCHGAHDFDRQLAAIDACLGCHSSDHVNAYEGSAHARLSELAFSGNAPEESAVTCATCHMPRETRLVAGREVTHVQHNQNANLRPSDKMLRGVCMNCHSLAFSMDALADTTLVESNFTGLPQVHVESIDMAVKRRQAIIGRDRTYR